MRFDRFTVSHISKKKLQDPFHLPRAFSSESLPGTGFSLETCQRWLSVSVSDQGFAAAPGQGEVYHGKEAYLFLLKVAAGLESEVLGETDIFGQIKDAWRKATQTQASELTSIMPRIFEDTKEIRSLYLRNLGGASYGSLVRKVITGSGVSGPTFLVGAGKIALSVAPFLLDSELWIWNRSSERLEEMMQELKAKLTEKEFSKIRSIAADTDAPEVKEAWKQAAHLVLCVPAEPEQDAIRVQYRESSAQRQGTIVHLGGLRAACGPWLKFQPQDRFHALDDLFALQSSIGNHRSVQIARAIRACEERAKLRALGSSLSIPHGWEDLACFA